MADRAPRRARVSSAWPALVAALAASMLAIGCQTDGPPRASSSDAAAQADPLLGRHPEFDARRAYADLTKLDRVGDRETGSRGAERARSYLRSRLEAAGIEVHEHSAALPDATADGEPRLARALVGVLPGASSDVFLLAAHYDSWPGYGEGGAEHRANPPRDDASAPALLLELARALAERPLPYTVWLVFVDGDGYPSRADLERDAPAPSFPGSEAFVESIAERGALARVRLAVYFDRVGAEHIMIARDIRSHRVYREVFWESARDLGKDSVFGVAERPVSVPSGREAFLRRGMRRAVAVTASDPSLELSGGAPPAADSGCCSVESLQAVGVVSLEALGRIAGRLDRIDRFSRSPLETAKPLEPVRPLDPAAPLAPARPLSR